MHSAIKARLEKLNADFVQNGNAPFNYFYCPILHKDENVELCKAHIINKTFKNTSRKWTVQRKDVDSFFGSNFEADFTLLQDANELSISDKLTDQRFSPTFLVNQRPVQHYIAKNDIPAYFTPIEFADKKKIIHLGLKISPEEMDHSQNKQWSIDVISDVRIAALVSLIKSAYLTMFHLFGYSYVLSAAGTFVGKQILGDFYLQNYMSKKDIVNKNAYSYFKQYVHMIRPVQFSRNLKGTINDKNFMLCRDNSSGSIWAIIVFIKIPDKLHSVLLPVFDNLDMIETFMDFMRNKNESISTTFSHYDKAQEKWEIAPGSFFNINWPKNGTLYP